MPCGDLAEVHGADAHEACALWRDRFDEISHHYAFLLLGNSIRDREGWTKRSPVNRELDFYAARHPDPRTDILQESGANLRNALNRAEVQHGNEILALI